MTTSPRSRRWRWVPACTSTPWSGRLELLQTASMPPGSIREKVPLEVTPLMPFLTYADEQAAH